MKIAIAGVGYVGLVTAVCFADHGHDVSCTDVDAQKLELLQAGQAPFFEPGLSEMLQKNSQRLTFVDVRCAYADAELIFICVGTPENLDGSANLRYVCDCARQIAQYAKRDAVVVVKSTVPIGTNDRVERLLREHGGQDAAFEVASNPEFLAQGTAIRDTLHAARIVIGTQSERAEALLRIAYRDFGPPLLSTDRRSAEMIKYACNDFLALKISYINEIANICELVGANVEHISQGMGMDPRIGAQFLLPGVGYGGSCFPKDTKALHWMARYHDYEIKTVKAAIEVNENQKIRLLKKAKKYYEKFHGLRVAVLGITFKPETDDLRDAPALTTISLLLENDANVTAYDPAGLPNLRKMYGDQITYAQSAQDAICDADLCFVFTEWKQVKACTAREFALHMRRPIVIDGRNCFCIEDMEAAGVSYESIGRRAVNTQLRHA